MDASTSDQSDAENVIGLFTTAAETAATKGPAAFQAGGVPVPSAPSM